MRHFWGLKAVGQWPSASNSHQPVRKSANNTRAAATIVIEIRFILTEHIVMLQ
jgi:hypothetical protein